MQDFWISRTIAYSSRCSGVNLPYDRPGAGDVHAELVEIGPEVMRTRSPASVFREFRS